MTRPTFFDDALTFWTAVANGIDNPVLFIMRGWSNSANGFAFWTADYPDLVGEYCPNPDVVDIVVSGRTSYWEDNYKNWQRKNWGRMGFEMWTRQELMRFVNQELGLCLESWTTREDLLWRIKENNLQFPREDL